MPLLTYCAGVSGEGEQTSGRDNEAGAKKKARGERKMSESTRGREGVVRPGAGLN